MNSNFKPATKQEWLNRVEKELKGKPLSALDFKIAGQTTSPIHHSEDQAVAPEPIPGMPSGHRLIGCLIDATGDPKTANQIALDALSKGADLIVFQIPHLDTLSKKDKKLLLAGILTDIVTIIFSERLHKHPSSPLLFQEGDNYHFDALQDDLADALFAAMETFSEEGAYQPTFHVSTSDDYYVSLAKLRALRLCWWRVSEEFNKPTNCRIIAHVRPKDLSDPNHNKIAATTHAMSAIIGGADGLIVQPSDGDASNAFSRRVALNLQHLLEYESHLHGVSDAAAGGYFLETLTNRLAKKTWSEFQALFHNPLYKL